MERGTPTGKTHTFLIPKVLFAWICKKWNLIIFQSWGKRPFVAQHSQVLCWPDATLGHFSTVFAPGRGWQSWSCRACCSLAFAVVWVAYGLCRWWDKPFHPWASFSKLEEKVLSRGAKSPIWLDQSSHYTCKEVEAQQVKEHSQITERSEGTGTRLGLLTLSLNFFFF